MIKPHTTKKALTREDKLLTELCAGHLYMFMDSLPSRDRSTMIYTRRKRKRRRGETGPAHDLMLAVVIKLAVPADGALGRRIVEMRAKKAGEAKARSRRPKMRPLSKVGAGPR